MNSTGLNIVFNAYNLAEVAYLIEREGSSTIEYLYCVNRREKSVMAVVEKFAKCLGNFEIIRDLKDLPDSLCFDRVITNTNLCDKKIPTALYEKAALTEDIIYYGSDTMSLYPSLGNNYGGARIKKRCFQKHFGLVTWPKQDVPFHLIEAEAIKPNVKALASLFPKYQVPFNEPFVLFTLQSPVFFKRDRGFTDEIFRQLFARIVKQLVDQSYCVLIKHHYRSKSAQAQSLENIAPGKIQFIQESEIPAEVLVETMDRKPSATVGLWSTTLLTLPGLFGIPSFCAGLDEHFRCLENWFDIANTRFGLYLYKKYIPPIDMLSKENPKEVFDQWLRDKQPMDKDLEIKSLYHTLFEMADKDEYLAIADYVRGLGEVKPDFYILLDESERRVFSSYSCDDYAAYAQLFSFRQLFRETRSITKSTGSSRGLLSRDLEGIYKRVRPTIKKILRKG